MTSLDKEVAEWLKEQGFTYQEYDYGYVKITDKNGNKLHPDTATFFYTAFRKAFESAMEAVIGENFINWGELDTDQQALQSAKNDLRREQRQRAEEQIKLMFGE